MREEVGEALTSPSTLFNNAASDGDMPEGGAGADEEEEEEEVDAPSVFEDEL